MNLSAEYVRSRLDYDPETGQFRWKPDIGIRTAGRAAGWIKDNGYVVIDIDKKKHYAHRLAWLYVYGEWPPSNVDHIDRDRQNNRIGNLRLADHFLNGGNANLSKRNKSGFKGVHWRSDKRRWSAEIRAHGRRVRLGYFDTAESAADAYAKAARKHFGEFASYTFRRV